MKNIISVLVLAGMLLISVVVGYSIIATFNMQRETIMELHERVTKLERNNNKMVLMVSDLSDKKLNLIGKLSDSVDTLDEHLSIEIKNLKSFDDLVIQQLKAISDQQSAFFESLDATNSVDNVP